MKARGQDLQALPAQIPSGNYLIFAPERSPPNTFQCPFPFGVYVSRAQVMFNTACATFSIHSGQTGLSAMVGVLGLWPTAKAVSCQGSKLLG